METHSRFIQLWYFIMILLCLSSYITGLQTSNYVSDKYDEFIIIAVDLAEKEIRRSDLICFIVHGCLGTILFCALCVYLCFGLTKGFFIQCFPFTLQQLRQTKNDLSMLVRFRVPEYRRYYGLSGLVHFFGILILCWFSVSGAIIHYFSEPGASLPANVLAIQDAHVKGHFLIPCYLVMHIGEVVLYVLNGNQPWKKMFFLKKGSETTSVSDEPRG